MRKGAKYIKMCMSIFVLLLFGACEYLDSLTLEGEIEVCEIPVDAFSKIRTEASYELILIKSLESKVVLEGMDYLMEDVIVDIQDGWLVLDHQKPINIKKSTLIKAYVYSPNFTHVTFNQKGKLSTQENLSLKSVQIVINGKAAFTEVHLNIDCNNFSLFVYGGDNIGQYYLVGACTNATIVLEGTVNVWGEDFVTERSKIIHRSIGKCEIHANTLLDVTIGASGNTYFTGDPEIQVTKESNPGLQATGKVIPLY